MKRPLIITTGIVIILLVLGVWIFLMLFGAPEKPSDVFSDLGIINPTERPQQEAVSTAPQSNTDLLSLSGNPLQQLTTEQVAGFAFATSGIKTLVRYVEKGTGYIYEIDLITGIKKQISRTTIPNTVEAIFSPNASVVIFVSEDEKRKVIIGEIPENIGTELQRTILPSESSNMSFEDDGKIVYTLSNTQQTIGYIHNIRTQNETELFSVDVPDLVMKWGSSFEKKYAYTKPTRYFEGFLYTIENSQLVPVVPASYELTPILSNDKVIITSLDKKKKEYMSIAYTSDSLSLKQPIIMLPEKCTSDVTDTNVVWCATELGTPNSNFLEDWYKGIVSSQDFIWKINLVSQTAELILNPEKESGRILDVMNIISDIDGKQLMFINKTDSTLWIYDTTNN